MLADDFEGRIRNFRIGQDTLELHGTGFSSLEAMIDADAIDIRRVGRDTVLSFAGLDDYHLGHGHSSEQVILKGVTGDLVASGSIVLT